MKQIYHTNLLGKFRLNSLRGGAIRPPDQNHNLNLCAVINSFYISAISA
jgi:hypothetical protein